MRNPVLRTASAVVLPVLLLVTVQACASSRGSDRGDSRILTAAQLEETRALDLFDAIRRARPLWLRSRSPRSLGAIDTRILIYFNGSLLGSSEETLRNLPIEGIHRVEYLDAAEAGLLPGAGTGHVQAAFMVYTAGDH